MALQHPENLFRRYRGQLVTVRTISGGIYEGTVTEVTNDFVELLQQKDGESAQVFVLFHSIESMTASQASGSS